MDMFSVFWSTEALCYPLLITKEVIFIPVVWSWNLLQSLIWKFVEILLSVVVRKELGFSMCKGIKFDICMKVFAVILLEITYRVLIFYFYSNDLCESHLRTDGQRKINMAVQTTGPWQKRIRSKERTYSELIHISTQKLAALRNRRSCIHRRGKNRVGHMEKDYHGKHKMLAGVSHRVVHMGSQIEALSHRIKENRHNLDVRRQQNKVVIERYDGLNTLLNTYLQGMLDDNALLSHTSESIDQ